MKEGVVALHVPKQAVVSAVLTFGFQLVSKKQGFYWLNPTVGRFQCLYFNYNCVSLCP